MDTPPDQEIREAVIKLEAKMEQMSGAVQSMAISVEKLADIKYDLREARKDAENNYQKCKDNQGQLRNQQEELKKSNDNAWRKLREIEDTTSRNAWFVGNAERLGWIVVTGLVGFIYYIMKEFSQ